MLLEQAGAENDEGSQPDVPMAHKYGSRFIGFAGDGNMARLYGPD